MSNLTAMDKRISKHFGTAKETPQSIEMLENTMSITGLSRLAPLIVLDIKVPTDTKQTEKEG